MLLIFTACLLASPVDCRNERVVLDATPMQCLTRAQIILATWADEHPKRARNAGFAAKAVARERD